LTDEDFCDFASLFGLRKQGYPAWEIDGKLFFGEQSMEDFDEILRTGEKANDPYADLLKEIDEMEKQAS